MSVLHVTTATLNVPPPPITGFSGGKSQFNSNSYGEFQFVNYMKSAQGWGTIDPAAYNFDTDGYPQLLPAPISALIKIPTNQQKSWAMVGPSGPLTLDWLGAGTLTVTGMTVVGGTGSLVSTGSGRSSVTLMPITGQHNNLGVGISAIGSPRITDIRFYFTADKPDIDAGKVFSPEYRAVVANAKFGVFRWLNWGGPGSANFSMLTTWASRRSVNHVFWLYPGEQRRSMYLGPTTGHSVSSGQTTYVLSDGGSAPTHNKTILFKWGANIQTANFTATIAAGVMTVTGTPTGNPIAVGMTIQPNGNATSNILIIGAGTGAGGAGTYYVNSNQTFPNGATIANGYANLLQYNGVVKPLISSKGILVQTQAPDTGRPSLNQYAGAIFDAVLDSWMVYGGNGYSAYLENGIPFEVFIQACVEVGCQPWICAPYLASSPEALADTSTSWCYQADQYIKNFGPSWMVPIWEPPNEQWNTQFPVFQWSNTRQYIAMGGTKPWEVPVAPFACTAIDSYVVSPPSVIMSIEGPLPPVGALVTTNSNSDASIISVGSLFGFAANTGYITASGGGKVTMTDDAPSGGSFAGLSGAATFTLAGSTVALPFDVKAGQGITFSTTGALPTSTRDSVIAGRVYYAKSAVSAGTGTQLSLVNIGSPGVTGVALDFSTGSQSGTHTAKMVIPFSISEIDNNDGYAVMCSCLGQTIAASRGVTQANVKTQTQYKFALGIATRDGDFPATTHNQDARASARSFVLTNNPVSPFTATAAHLWSTHITPNNYIGMATMGSGAQETALINAAGAVQMVVTIASGTMTVASIIAGSPVGINTTNIPTGLTLFGEIGLYQARGVTITTNNGGGSYTISDSSVSIPAGTVITGANLTPIRTAMDAFKGATFNGQTSTGPSLLTVNTPPVGCPIYVGMTVRDGYVGINQKVTVAGFGTGTGGAGTYSLSSSSLGTLAARSMSVNGNYDIPRVIHAANNWKTWAQGFGIQKMMCYEGGSTYDPGTAAQNLFYYVVSNCTSSPLYPNGLKDVIAESYAAFDNLTDGTFTFEYPSCFQLDGRYPSNNGYSVMQTIYQNPVPPQMAAIIEYNAG